MCLAALAIGQDDRFPFVLLANRDEAFDRPAAAMAWWPGQTRLLAGRDLTAGGTWLGLTRPGRLALVTNVREPGRVLPGSPSRGELVPQWLASASGPDDTAALQALGAVARNGFNLLVADLDAPAAADATGVAARWLSNRPQLRHQGIGPGVHGLSNAALDTPWPKTVTLKQRLREALAAGPDLAGLQARGLAALADPDPAPDAQLPATGLPLLRERQLSPAFIRILGADPSKAVYGTRCTTVVVVQRDGAQRSVHALERSFGPAGDVTDERHHDWVLPAR